MTDWHASDLVWVRVSCVVVVVWVLHKSAVVYYCCGKHSPSTARMLAESKCLLTAEKHNFFKQTSVVPQGLILLQQLSIWPSCLLEPAFLLLRCAPQANSGAANYRLSVVRRRKYRRAVAREDRKGNLFLRTPKTFASTWRLNEQNVK